MNFFQRLFRKRPIKRAELEMKHNPRATRGVLQPQQCPQPIDAAVAARIDAIDWEQYGTAYGKAGDTIPYYLKNLYCSDQEIALGATHQLWCSLCHQHLFVSTAALPAYPFLIERLATANDALKVELLDIFLGFANCSTQEVDDQEYRQLYADIRERLLQDRKQFEAFADHKDRDARNFCKEIMEVLAG